MTTRIRHLLVIPAALLALTAAALAAVPPATAPDDAPDSPDIAPRTLRIVEDADRSVALEIAARDFTRPAGGPRVTLVGVAHIARRDYYRSIEHLLDDYDVVLYESVMPAGTGGAGGETDSARVDSTRAAIGFIAAAIESHRLTSGSLPDDLDDLGDFLGAIDPRLADALDIARLDAWHRPIRYAPGDGGTSYDLASLGADGRVGGTGPDADVSLADQDPPEPLHLDETDNLQGELARALGLAFQLEAIDYDHPNWRLSDMAIDQLQHELDERGADWQVIGGTLAGTSLPARLIRFLLRVVSLADSFLDGAIADTIKVALIEVLGDEDMIEQSLGQFGAGLVEVLIDRRNQIVIDDLDAIIHDEPEVASVAILYGAGHMPDLASRLADQLGYEPAEARWLRAIDVDLTTSAVDPRQLRQMRMMMRTALRRPGAGSGAP